MDHRRRIYTVIQKARQTVVVSVWGQDRMQHWAFLVGMCGIVYTDVVLFPLLLLGGGDDFCRFVFQV